MYYRSMTAAERLAEEGVLFDELLLLKPDLEYANAVRTKISTTLAEVRRGIDAARAAGRHVLYLPGSYDVVHLGHALHIEQAVRHYLALPEHASLTAEKIFVLTLADDDHLIASAKAHKFTGNGGDEPFRRPVQSASEYCGARDVVNWRLFELASIPRVQMVGFIPSPVQAAALASTDMIATQRNPDELPALLAQFRSAGDIPEHDLGSLEASVGQYRDTLRLLRDEPARITAAFNRRVHPWSIQAWQLFIHCYLGAGTYDAPIVRMMSHHDDLHGYQVGFLMQAAGIRTLYLHEESLVTTSGLLATHGAQTLLDAKRAHYI